MSRPDSPDPSPTATAPGGRAGRIMRNTGILAVSSLVVRAMGMVMMVVLARYLGPEGYGTYQRAESFVFLFSIVANLGLDMILAREVARRSPRAPQEIAGVLMLKVILGLAAFALVLSIAAARGYHGDFLWAIWMYAIVQVLSAVGQAIDAVFQGREDMHLIGLANIANQLVFVGLGAAFVWLGRDLRWILSSLVVAGVVRLAISATLLARLRLPLAWPEWDTLGYLFRQAIPIAFAAGFVIVYQQLDAVLLGEMKGNAEVGWYRAGAKFLLFYTVLRESFLTAMYPVFSAVAGEHDRERMGDLVTRTVRYLLIVALYFVLCFAFLPRVAPKLLGADFANTANVLPIMAWLLVPQTIGIVMGRALVASGNQHRVMVATGLSLVANVVLNLMLIPRYGYIGAAFAGIVSETGVALVNTWYVRRYVAATRILRAIARPVAAAGAVALFLYFTPGLRLWQALPLAALLYALALWLLRTFTPGEIRRSRELVALAVARVTRRDSEGIPADPA